MKRNTPGWFIMAVAIFYGFFARLVADKFSHPTPTSDIWIIRQLSNPLVWCIFTVVVAVVINYLYELAGGQSIILTALWLTALWVGYTLEALFHNIFLDPDLPYGWQDAFLFYFIGALFFGGVVGLLVNFIFKIKIWTGLSGKFGENNG